MDAVTAVALYFVGIAVFLFVGGLFRKSGEVVLALAAFWPLILVVLPFVLIYYMGCKIGGCD